MTQVRSPSPEVVRPALAPDPVHRVRDAVVVGAGFGGLGAALTLAEAGADVVLCERLSYPGGCASTFERDGYSFEAGATLVSGFGPGQLLTDWVERLDLPVRVDPLDPVVELRSPDHSLSLGARSGDLERALGTLPGVPQDGLRAFFRLQRRVADALWAVLDAPHLLPPLDLRAVAQHLRRAARYLPLVGLVGRPLERTLERFGLAGHPSLRLVLDALCQITVQCPAGEAEAPFALACLDYLQRGTVHVRGGIGNLAQALCGAIEARGGQVRLAAAVHGFERDGKLWRVRTRHGELRARNLLVSRLPRDLAAMLPMQDPARARALDRAPEVEQGWGAVMLYRVVRVPDPDQPARHLQLVQDPGSPLVEGNHLFASLSGPRDRRCRADRDGPAHLRTLTVSTHLDLGAQYLRGPLERGLHVAAVQERLRRGLRNLAPEWEDVVLELTASPRTWERFTGRGAGLVGGVPRRSGRGHYRHLGPARLGPGLWALGDSVFPGQSVLATATGGQRAAVDLLRRSGSPSAHVAPVAPSASPQRSSGG